MWCIEKSIQLKSAVCWGLWSHWQSSSSPATARIAISNSECQAYIIHVFCIWDNCKFSSYVCSLPQNSYQGVSYQNSYQGISSHILPIPLHGPTVPILKVKVFHWVWRQTSHKPVNKLYKIYFPLSPCTFFVICSMEFIKPSCSNLKATAEFEAIKRCCYIKSLKHFCLCHLNHRLASISPKEISLMSNGQNGYLLQ